MRKQLWKRLAAFVAALVLCLSCVATALAAYDTIPYGEQSDNVRRLQDALKAKGYYSGAVDGKFGPNTRKAVVRFQRSVGLTEDGKPGNKTLTALYEGKSALNSTRDSEKRNVEIKNPRSLYYGCSGSRVKTLQRALRAAGCYKGAIDGVYGDLTYKAVLAYQYKKGLNPDGIAGVKTIASLNRNTKAGISYGFLLDIGSTGREVRVVGKFLTDMGFDLSNSDANTYTEQVAEAVRSWQEMTGKDVTGTITEAQYNAIVLGRENTADNEDEEDYEY